MDREQRQSVRRYVLQGARIAGNNVPVENCWIVDISASGAQLKVKSADTVPNRFILLLSRDGRLQRQCEVVWRSENAIGVRFMTNSKKS